MSEHKDMLADAVTRLFRDAGDVASEAERDGWQQALWAQVEELGLPQLLLPEARGGVGGDWEDLYAVLRASGRHAIPLPLGETMLAAKLAVDAGIEPAPGPASLAVDVRGALRRDGAQPVFSGELRGVPWGRDVGSVFAVLPLEGRMHVVRLLRTDATLRAAQNLAFEPRDDLSFEHARVEAVACAAVRELFVQCALLRVDQITGALEAALQRSIEYAMQRKQFGRPIGQFQAVQQQLAVFGAEVAAVACAAQAASRAACSGDALFQIAAAKLRANLAIGVATATAHQVHAAIGFTQEYALRHATQRLWSWRSEYGNDRYWADRIGAQLAARGADAFWSDLTERDDAS